MTYLYFSEKGTSRLSLTAVTSRSAGFDRSPSSKAFVSSPAFTRQVGRRITSGSIFGRISKERYASAPFGTSYTAAPSFTCARRRTSEKSVPFLPRIPRNDMPRATRSLSGETAESLDARAASFDSMSETSDSPFSSSWTAFATPRTFSFISSTVVGMAET